MRKVRPQDVLAEFLRQADDQLAHYDRVLLALAGTANEKLDISLMSKNMLHAVFVDFECFISDLFVSYLNRDFSQYQDTFEAAVKKSASDKHSPWLAGRITFNRPAHVSLDELAEAIDPTGWNTTFKDSTVMKQKAQQWLAEPYRSKVLGLDDEDSRLIDTARALRNWIAHQSAGARKKMNDMLRDIEQGPGTPNHELGRGVREIKNIGSFLKKKINGERCVQIYVRRLKDAAQNLTV
ncbi:hypothetical protein [Stutzerimonas nitrititolerans]|uniref:hypothetical protein n=1 Tax=Stutzerimonas nitrititolerans TaxID=2482751 RepID=UPI0028AC27A1|nr:hypothetical protein [Stutzerimonas nitrititolerans]